MPLPPFEQVLGLFVCGVAGAGAAYKLALDLEALRASTRHELEALRASAGAVERMSKEMPLVMEAGSKVHSMHRAVEGLSAEWEAERGRMTRCERNAADALRAATECKVQQAEWATEVNEAMNVSQRSASDTQAHRQHTQALVRGAIRTSRASMQEMVEEMQRCMDKTERCQQEVGDMMAYTQTMQEDNERMKGELVEIANKVLEGLTQKRSSASVV